VIWERVAQVLLEKGRLTRSQLLEARRTQGFFGGPLASHLLRLGFVDEPALGEAMSDVFGVPFAGPERFEAVDAGTRAILPEGLLARHRVFPLHAVGHRVAVAMADPRDRAAIAEIESATGRTVEPWVASELRIQQAIARPAAPVPAPDPALDPLAPLLEFHDLAAELGEAPRPEPAPSPPAPAPAPDPMAELESALLAAADREDVASALLRFCATRTHRAALFAVTRDTIRGLDGHGAGMERERVRTVSLPRGGSSILDSALASRDFYFGVVPELAANRDLYSVLGGSLPSAVLILPVRVKDRTAALLYLDEGDRPLTRPDIPLMRRVAAKAGLAFELLLLRTKLRGV
jgi:hypothetical protein